MTLRTGLLIVLLLAWAGCSNNSTRSNNEETMSLAGNALATNPVSEEYSIVCGVLFSVEDFNHWQKSYLAEAQNTIIYLKSANDPNMVMVFEANQTLKKAKARVGDLMGERFLAAAGVKGRPTANYYDVHYYKPAKISDTHFLVLSFRIKDFDQLELFGKSQFDHFSKLGMRPIGLGSNPIKADEVYMFFTVKDVDFIHEKSDTPGKLKEFLIELNLPTDANMSHWVKP